MSWKLIISPPLWKKCVSSKKGCWRGKLWFQPSCGTELEKSEANCEGDPYLFNYEWLNCLHIILGNWIYHNICYLTILHPLGKTGERLLFYWVFEEFKASLYEVLSHGARNVTLGCAKWLPLTLASEGWSSPKFHWKAPQTASYHCLSLLFHALWLQILVRLWTILDVSDFKPGAIHSRQEHRRPFVKYLQVSGCNSRSRGDTPDSEMGRMRNFFYMGGYQRSWVLEAIFGP